MNLGFLDYYGESKHDPSPPEYFLLTEPSRRWYVFRFFTQTIALYSVYTDWDIRTGIGLYTDWDRPSSGRLLGVFASVSLDHDGRVWDVLGSRSREMASSLFSKRFTAMMNSGGSSVFIDCSATFAAAITAASSSGFCWRTCRRMSGISPLIMANRCTSRSSTLAIRAIFMRAVTYSSTVSDFVCFLVHISDIVCQRLRSLGKYRVRNAVCKCSNVSFWLSSRLSNQEAAWARNNNGKSLCWLSAFKFLYLIQFSRYVHQSLASSFAVPLKKDGLINDADADETAAVINAAGAAISGWGGPSASPSASSWASMDNESSELSPWADWLSVVVVPEDLWMDPQVVDAVSGNASGSGVFVELFSSSSSGMLSGSE